MEKLWRSITLSGMFLLVIALGVLFHRVSPGIAGEYIVLDTRLGVTDEDVNVARLAVNLDGNVYLEEFPETIGVWKMQGQENSDDLEAQLDANILLMRTYRETMSSRPIFFLIVHADTTYSIHPPELCYTAAGYEVEWQGLTTISFDDSNLLKTMEGYEPDSIGEWASTEFNLSLFSREIAANELIVQRINEDGTEEKRIVYYIFLKELGFSTSEYTMVRVSTLLPLEGDTAAIRSETREFMGLALSNLLDAYTEIRPIFLETLLDNGLKGYLVTGLMLLVPLSMISYPILSKKIFVFPGQGSVSGVSENIQGYPSDNNPVMSLPVTESGLPLELRIASALEGTQGREKVLAAYSAVRELIEEKSCISPMTDTSFREYLIFAETLLDPGTLSLFTDLSQLAELVSYSSSEPEKWLVEDAVELAYGIEKNLATKG